MRALPHVSHVPFVPHARAAAHGDCERVGSIVRQHRQGPGIWNVTGRKGMGGAGGFRHSMSRAPGRRCRLAGRLAHWGSRNCSKGPGEAGHGGTRGAPRSPMGRPSSPGLPPGISTWRACGGTDQGGNPLVDTGSCNRARTIASTLAPMSGLAGPRCRVGWKKTAREGRTRANPWRTQLALLGPGLPTCESISGP